MSGIRGVAITTVGNFIAPLAALITQPMLAYGLGLDGRGEVAAATAPLLFAAIVLTLGLPESLTYFIARKTNGVRRATKQSIALLVGAGALGSAAIALFSIPLSAGDLELAHVMSISGCALMPALIVAGLRGLAAGNQLWNIIAIERLISAIFQLIAVSVLFVTDTLSPLSASLAVSISTFLGGAVYIFTRSAISSDAINVRNVYRPRVFQYASKVWVGSVTGVALVRLDQLLMTPLAGVAELGIYIVAVAISDVILLFNSAVRDVMFAVEADNPDPHRLTRASRLSTLITLTLGLAVAAACPWVIPIMFGAEFNDATVVTLLLIGGIILGNPGSVAAAGLSARGRPGLRSISLGIAAVVNLIAVLLLVPQHGAWGAAIAILIGRIVSGNLAIIWMRTFYGVPMIEFYHFRSADIRSLWIETRNLLSHKQKRGNEV